VCSKEVAIAMENFVSATKAFFEPVLTGSRAQLDPGSLPGGVMDTAE
jgi:hypothetical protein